MLKHKLTAQASQQAAREVVCEVCLRASKKERGKKGHKCSSERQKQHAAI